MEQRIIQSLLAPSAYPEPTSNVHLVQTHVSFIFITDNFAYKIKKPVDFGFLNFTSLDRRRFYCTEEVRLNRRLCPDIYLGVVEVRETPEGGRIDGEGMVIDYAVKMKRLPEELMMEHLLQTGRLYGDDIGRIARTIGEFHLAAERGEEIDRYGSPAEIRRTWEENIQQVSRFVPDTITARDLRIIADWGGEYLDRHDALFTERVSQGFIRDCDGDIHMGNICLADRVWIFDCIEFNSRFRYTDTAADIAFLMMDLDFHGRSDLSELFLAEYVVTTGDREVAELLDYYRIYRAVVRGKVESLKLLDPQIAEDDRETAGSRARRYLRLARGYAVRGRLPPSLIITSGLMGSGKSSIAAVLSFELGLKLFSSDRTRKELAHLPPDARDASGYGAGIYAASFTDRTYNMLLARAEEAIRAGRSVIVDATFRRKRDRARFRNAAEKLSVPFYLINTVCPENITRHRLDERMKDPLRVSDGRSELYGQQSEEFEPVEADEERPIYVDTTLPVHANIEALLSAMGII